MTIYGSCMVLEIWAVPSLSLVYRWENGQLARLRSGNLPRDHVVQYWECHDPNPEVLLFVCLFPFVWYELSTQILTALSVWDLIQVGSEKTTGREDVRDGFGSIVVIKQQKRWWSGLWSFAGLERRAWSNGLMCLCGLRSISSPHT